MAARLHRNEYMGMLGGALLAVSVFVPWYGTDSSNRFANIDGERGNQSCFDVHPILRWLLLAAAVAPFILAYIVADDISAISLKLGWFGALVGTLLMIVGAALRSSEHERARKPPGTI